MYKRYDFPKETKQSRSDYNEANREVCYVVTPQGLKQREVQTGSFNDIYVQIISGLEVGEKVLLSHPRLNESE